MTAQEFLSQLPYGVREEVLRYCRDYALSAPQPTTDSFGTWVFYAFDWSRTPQGHEFWEECKNHLTPLEAVDEVVNWFRDNQSSVLDAKEPKQTKDMKTEIVYQLTGNTARGQVADYHRKPAPLPFHQGAKHSDVRCFGRNKRKVVTKDYRGDYKSRFTIGMEVEKNSLHRDSIHEHVLFCGMERDGSCGYEAVTNILPLLPHGKWRSKVVECMWKAEKIIDDAFSAGDDSCGGHITVACDGMNGDELRKKLRPLSGIILALYRNRLKNRYCGGNMRMAGDGDDREDFLDGHSDSRTRADRYQVALVKGDCLEFRLVSRFVSVNQMVNRYDLFYVLMDEAINMKRPSHERLLKRLRPILMDMFGGDERKVDNLFDMARKFRLFILEGKIHPTINKWVNPHGHWDRYVIKKVRVAAPKAKKAKSIKIRTEYDV